MTKFSRKSGIPHNIKLTAGKYKNPIEICRNLWKLVETYCLKAGTINFHKFQSISINFNRAVIICIPVLLSQLYFGICQPAYAAPCYGTKLPQQKKFFSGLQTHAIKKRHLENNSGKLKSTQHLLLLSYGIFDWLSLDLKGGFGNIRKYSFQGDNLTYPSFLAGGYGFRLKFYDSGNAKMVFGFQHISAHPETISIGNGKNKAVLDDWQFSLLASAVFKKITPYLGLKWSRTDYIHWVDNQRERVKSDLTEGIGLVCGLDFPVTEKIWLNLESQILDSLAFACSINYSF